MSHAIKQNEPLVPEMELSMPAKIAGLWPVIIPILMTVALIVARIELGPRGFLYEGALTLLALICYMSAAVIIVTNLFVKEQVLSRLGLITVSLGYCFNLSGWMMRWVEAGDAEGWKAGINGAWRYFPLDNLYPLTLGFCAGAAVTTLLIIRKPKYEFLGAMSMPIVTVVLTLAIFLGNEIRTLPPILDSYWRPIHVSIATVAYGVCLVSFGIAFAYLLKDGVRSEAIAIGAGLFGLLIYGTVGRFGVPFHGEYGIGLLYNKTQLPVRAVLPGMGPLMVVTLLAIAASIVLFAIDWVRTDEKARRVGWRIFRLSALLQAVVLALLFSWIAFPQKMASATNLSNFVAQIPEREKPAFGEYLNKQMNADWPADRHQELAQKWLAQEDPAQFSLSMKSNPVEFGGLIGLFVVLFLVSLFAWRRE
ncbi:MAG TPA: cytochrome c biogenesis protein CcsA, partial [Blastocatellia bacterium]|nr:cytochrome c biogenesis protein CcsA [Blastocatellia bacterium]